MSNLYNFINELNWQSRHEFMSMDVIKRKDLKEICNDKNIDIQEKIKLIENYDIFSSSNIMWVAYKELANSK
jgi:hypothetical protein